MFAFISVRYPIGLYRINLNEKSLFTHKISVPSYLKSVPYISFPVHIHTYPLSKPSYTIINNTKIQGWEKQFYPDLS